jgi:diaminopimelate epimerase
MDLLPFAKGHGTGNDFVIIPDPEGRLALTPDLVAAVCDRRTGIGADGVLRVIRDGPVWFMDYRNADGSVAEMCGNGVRVFARYLVTEGLAAPGEVSVRTRAGDIRAVVSAEAVSVTMSPPRVGAAALARLPDGRQLPGVAVDCGNPHLVCPVPADVDLSELDLSVPPGVDKERFPDGVNVEFTTVEDGPRQIRMRVHERGVGETRSCGSGACAAAAVVLRETGGDGGPVTVDVPGGRLTVSLTGDEWVLTGPAVLVARGSIEVAALG